MNVLTSGIGLSVNQAIALNNALADYRAADSLTATADAAGRITSAMRGTEMAAGDFARAVNKSQIELYAAAKAASDLAASGPRAGWMNPAIVGTDALIARLRVAVALATTVNAKGGASVGVGISGGGTVSLFGGAGGGVGGGSGGGGGGGGSDPYQANLDRLVASLMTERETVEKWYADNEVILNDRRAMELLGAAGHKEAMLDLERQYHEKLSKIKDDSDAYNLGSTAKLFGDLNSLAGGGYDGLLRAQKSFAAAQALVNTYLGASQALADPKLPWFAKFAAVAKVVAAGMGLVNAIKGGSKSGGGGGSGGSGGGAAAASSQPVADRVTTVSFTGDPFMVAIANSVMAQMYDASGNGRVLIKA